MSTDILNKRIAMYYRANQISNTYREKFGMSNVPMKYEGVVCEFQEPINTTHCFNKYIKGLRDR